MYLWIYREELRLLGRSSNLSKNGGRECNGFPSSSLPRCWLSEQGCVIGSPHLIRCYTHFLLLNVTVSSLHLLSAILLCIQVFVEGNPVLDVPAYFLLIPICPIKFETSLLFARQAGCISFSVVSSDQYLGILKHYRELQNQCTALVPAAQWSLARYAGWIHSWQFMVRVVMDFTWSMKD